MKEFQELFDIINRLRGENGCEWDKKQTMESMRKYVLEEVYELFEAIDDKNIKEIKEEIGDILMHMVFLSKIASENNWFTMNEVLCTINEKLISRHPHVFSDIQVNGVNDILKNWEDLKKKEKSERKYLLDGIPKSLPAINRSIKIQEKLSRIGFKWGSLEEMVAKVEEELEELKIEIKNKDIDKAKSELGDVFFTLIGLGLMAEIDPETALDSTNHKIIQRCNFIEKELENKNQKLENTTILELEQLWQKSKNH